MSIFGGREARLIEALEAIALIQPTMLDSLQAAGVVFDEAPHPITRDDWQGAAFWLYTSLCEANSIATSALAEVKSTNEEDTP